MKALILNSGMGSRMGAMSADHPKCMTAIWERETILSRQLKMIVDAGIKEVVMTTGYCESVLTDYCQNLDLPICFSFVRNPEYQNTNYIYSIYCAMEFLEDDVLLMHGDLVFEESVLEDVLASDHSCMVVSSAIQCSEKDFKAVIEKGEIKCVGTDLVPGSIAAQPLYKLLKKDWSTWAEQIRRYCESGNRKCYGENALNEVLGGDCRIYPLDVQDRLCSEIDDTGDLVMVTNKLREKDLHTVYMCFSTDILHGGHLSILGKAQKLGRLIVGVMSDEAVASYKRYPLLPYEDRRAMFENITGVYRVVKQETLSYKENLLKYKPAYVVHGDDWKSGFQKPIRDEVITLLASYGGKLVEYPYAGEGKYKELEKRTRLEFSMPDARRRRLRKEIERKGLVTAMEAHDGLTGLIVENTVSYQNGSAHQFDAIWVSSLCDSTAKGKPDIELVDMTSRFQTIEDLMEVTTKPIIFDGDTGGRTEHFVYTVRSLERMGVSMIVIEDKTGLKKNSLFGTEVEQTQDSIENFSQKIRAGKQAQRTKDFMICARIESLILEQGMEDALERAEAFVSAGADAVMIHSRQKEPDEVFCFLERFRKKDSITPVVLVPTSYNSVTEEEFKTHGANVVIYANHLIRAAVPAIQKAASTILEHHRAMECDRRLMPFAEIIRLIPGDI